MTRVCLGRRLMARPRQTTVEQSTLPMYHAMDSILGMRWVQSPQPGTASVSTAGRRRLRTFLVSATVRDDHILVKSKRTALRPLMRKTHALGQLSILKRLGGVFGFRGKGGRGGQSAKSCFESARVRVCVRRRFWAASFASFRHLQGCAGRAAAREARPALPAIVQAGDREFLHIGATRPGSRSHAILTVAAPRQASQTRDRMCACVEWSRRVSQGVAGRVGAGAWWMSGR